MNSGLAVVLIALDRRGGDRLFEMLDPLGGAAAIGVHLAEMPVIEMERQVRGRRAGLFGLLGGGEGAICLACVAPGDGGVLSMLVGALRFGSDPPFDTLGILGRSRGFELRQSIGHFRFARLIAFGVVGYAQDCDGGDVVGILFKPGFVHGDLLVEQTALK